MEKEFQRWTAKRKVELLLQLIRGEKKLVEVCREHDLKQSEVETWMDTFVKGGERRRRAMRPRDASCERRSASWCWSWTREKNWQPCPGNPRPPSDGAGPDAHGGEGGGHRAALPVVRRTTVDLLLPWRTAASGRTRSRSRRARR